VSDSWPALPNIENLIDGDGEITIGCIGPISCAAVASDGHQALAMLVRRDHEDLRQLLMRLEAALDLAYEEDDFIDEINNGTDDRI
jgi:hypothetical protein